MHDCNRQVSVYFVFLISKIALCPGQSVTKLALNIETSMTHIVCLKKIWIQQADTVIIEEKGTLKIGNFAKIAK